MIIQQLVRMRLFLQEYSYLYRTSLYLAASASAEFFADMMLCPMEACKVRIQTQPGWANTLREGFPKLYGEEGMWGYVVQIVSSENNNLLLQELSAVFQ